jgi:hypothetical protein
MPPFTLAQHETITDNGFVVVPADRYAGMAEAYEALKKEGLPILVTTDVALHTAHLFFDRLLRVVELTAMRPALVTLTETLLEAAALDMGRARDRPVQEAARRNLAFFAVGARLLDPHHLTPVQVRSMVDAELALIEERPGSIPPPQSPVLGIREDYSQYIPRGHYTRNEAFRTYLLAALWYSRMGFFVYPSASHALSQGDTERLARQALLITRALYKEQVDGRPAIDLWRDIYETTALFSGRAEDPGPDEYLGLAEAIYGSVPNLRAVADEGKLGAFMAQARALPRPRVLSTFYLSKTQPDAITPRWQDGTLGFRLLPQRFVPDTHVFSELVWDRVGPYTGDGEPFTLYRSLYDGPYRAIPRGLDVLAAFGSALAERMIEEEGDADYEGYREKLAELRALYGDRGDTEHGRTADQGYGHTAVRPYTDLYHRWLNVLRALLATLPEDTSPETVPPLFRGESWACKQLHAALGAWAELRHDTILYVKQSYTSMAKSLSMPPPPMAYVEPYPLVYWRLESLVAQMRKELDQCHMLVPALRSRMIEFETLLDELRAVAVNELGGQWPERQEMARLIDLGDWLKAVLEFPPDLMAQITSGTDDRMAVVADVHTHFEGGVVLEEAVGDPFLICVELEREGQRARYWGAVFSYYEFKHPMDDRLTDEAWQAMSPKPARPPWTDVFVAE